MTPDFLKNYQKKPYIIAALIILAILFFIFFLLVPRLGALDRSSLKTLELQQDLAKLEAERSFLQDFRRQLGEVESNMAKIDSILIDSDVPIDFVQYLEGLALKSSLEIEISSASFQKAEKDSLDKALFQMTITGAAKDFLKFLAKLENSPYLIEIKQLQARTIKGIGAEARVSKEKIEAKLYITVFTK